MLNFSRFKYRRKACLEFYSSGKNKRESAPEYDSRYIQGKNEKPELHRDGALCTKDASSFKNATQWPNSHRRNNVVSDLPECNEASLGHSELENATDSGNRCLSSEKDKGNIKNSDREVMGCEMAPRGTSSTTLPTIKANVMSGGDRLSNILCNGISKYNDFLGTTNEASVQMISRKRKERIEDSPCVDHLEGEDDNQNRSSEFIKNSRRMIDSSKILKPKSKKKKVILVSSEDENGNEDETESSNCGTFEKEVIKDADNSLKSDIEKLREIYSHLTVSQAKEEIGNAGSLVDAILNLADTLDTKGNIGF